jgi:hypothetical protein
MSRARGGEPGLHPTDSHKPREARIEPVDLLHLPTVLDTADLMNVLRVGENRVRHLVAGGALRRLRYSREIKVYRGEVLRFLREQTDGEVL